LFSKKIQEILYRIYDGLPPKVRAFFSPVVPVFFFLKRVLIFASQFRLSVHLLEGKEKWGGESLTTLYLGDERGLLFLSDLLYSADPRKENLGKIFIWRIESRTNSHLPRADIIFIKIDGFFSRFLSRGGLVIIPEWILFMLDLSRPLPELEKLPPNKSLRENLRIFRRHNYSYEITRDPVKFKYFYDHMYYPYVMGKYGKITSGTDFKKMERIFRNGQLLLVKKGGDYISGIVIVRISCDTMFAYSLGITEGSIEYLRAGALTALYYFVILWAKERGYKWLDFGECRSFLNDGVLNYKKSWGMEMKISRRLMNIFGMKICNFHPGVRNFLENKPFIFMDQEKLKGLILVDQNHPLIPEEVQSLVKTYCIPGLDCLVILSDQGFTQQAEEFANSCSTQKLQLIGSKTDVFFEAFPHVLHLEKRNS
jgi:hypothetical protein